MKNEHRRAFWQVHLCVLLWGFTAILGKLITLPAQALVVWRMALVCIFLALLPKVWRGVAALKPKLILTYAGIGVIVALHWLTFYGAIKLSNASVAVSCLALGSVFAALIEPLFTDKAWNKTELLLGVLAIPGVVLLVGGVLLAWPGLLAGQARLVAAAVYAGLLPIAHLLLQAAPTRGYVRIADPETGATTAIAVDAAVAAELQRQLEALRRRQDRVFAQCGCQLQRWPAPALDDFRSVVFQEIVVRCSR